MTTFAIHPQLSQDSVVVRDLDLCRLLLINNSLYPWCVLVPMRDDLRELHELSADEQVTFLRESSQLSWAMLNFFRGEKMNVAALGNVVPQLHIHHIVRSSSDPAWPLPVWGHEPAVPYSSERIAEIVSALVEALDGHSKLSQ